MTCMYMYIYTCTCRYNALDQLSCIVCGVSIKSELLWTSHLASRKHKDTVALLKNKKSSVPQQPAPKEEGFVKPSAPPTAKRKLKEVHVTARSCL